MIQVLKIKQQYADRIVDRVKKFEIRKNDRDYQVGDIIRFKDDYIYFRVTKDDPDNSRKVGDIIRFKVLDNNCYEHIDINHPLTDTEWDIIYIHTGLGMEKGYVVLGIEPVSERKE